MIQKNYILKYLKEINKMKKCKLFENTNISKLEDSINEWINKNQHYATVLDILVIPYATGVMSHYIGRIFYDEKFGK